MPSNKFFKTDLKSFIIMTVLNHLKAFSKAQTFHATIFLLFPQSIREYFFPDVDKLKITGLVNP